MKRYFILISSLLLCFASILANAQKPNKVYTVGAMVEMGKNNFKPQVWLDTIPEKKHLFAIGPYDRMKGEIMVYDGKPFYASAFEEGKAVVSQSWDIRSPFFVYANVFKWDSFTISGEIKNLNDVQNKVAQIAQKNGFNLSEPFPFKVSGDFQSITTHIVTPRSSDVEGYRPDVKQQLFSFDNISGSLLGFYSQVHQGVFTSSNSYIHVHFLTEDQTFMGHLDKIDTQTKKLTVFFPAKKSSFKTELKVNDTDFSKGRLGLQHNLDLKDLEKFHGHLCDGLVVGYLGIKEGLDILYPSGIIDRTNTRIVSKGSPCLTDVAVYVSGGRYQFNSFYVDNSMQDGFYIVQRIDNGKAVKIQLNKGVKPKEIDALGAKAVEGTLPPCDLDKLKKMEDDFSETLLSQDPKDNFTVTEILNFEWTPILKNDYIKTDILNKFKLNCEANNEDFEFNLKENNTKKMKQTVSSLFPEIGKTISQLNQFTISEERKAVLQPLVDFIQSKASSNQEIRINFICTHNSRRSHLSQVWAQTMANYFQIKNVFCYSGGTEATALFPKVAESLQNSGFQIKTISKNDNPVYSIKYANNEHPIIGFSKKLDDEFNPKSGFAAIMTCNSADEACPVVMGAEKRISITYEDPKAFDNTPLQTEKYQERSLQIATEMFYVFSQIKL